MAHGLVNFSAFSVEDFYHPTLLFIYRIFWEVFLIITTVFFVFILYVILKNSKDIGEYKYFMINQLVWSYLFNLLASAWKPVPLWPFYMGFGAGWFRSWKGIWAVLPFYTEIAIGVGMGVSIFMSAMHRYIYMFPTSQFAKHYESLTFKLLFYGFVLIIIECGAIIPISLFYVDREVLRESITSKYPFMDFFFENEPSIFGYDPALNNQLSVLYAFLILIFLIGIIIFAFLMYLNFIRLMKKNKHTVSQITHQMQMILFKTLFVQLLLVLVFLLIPLLLALFFTAFGIRWTSFLTLVGIMFCSFHPLADFVALIYFIKPYRIFVLNIFRKPNNGMQPQNFIASTSAVSTPQQS
ncbi:hypothetical protein FO519_009902 [Halicephalobus sp. NKZ332]|nr:hypothetical protein FO519_009902 [Halicephalobus sp. NKZ332]